MIFYFSGTGNSQLAAKQIADSVQDEAVSINRYLKTGDRRAFRSECPLVFIAPTYAWRLPDVVDAWIRSTAFTGNQDAYFVLTCAGGFGNAEAYLRKLCQKKGFRFRGLAPVIMPENYLALFPTPDQDEARAILERSLPQAAALADMVKAGKEFPENKVSLLEKIKSGPVNRLFYQFSVSDKGFTATDACIACGKCAKRCPLNNIDMADGKPLWKGHCTHCMACIGGCPTEAIEYKLQSKGRHRYYIRKE